MKVSTVESVLDQFDTFHVFLKKRNSLSREHFHQDNKVFVVVVVVVVVVSLIV
jgi:hypothetical protein